MLVLAPALLTLALVPQGGRNVDLLGQLDPRGQYSDVWGYAHPSGLEYALLAAHSGTSVIDCTDPRNPVELAFFPAPTSTLRDIKTLGPYAYVVSEASGGLQIIDLSVAGAPVLVGTRGAAAFSHAHNVAVDTDTGWIYAVGTDVGTVVFDASVNPTEPSVVGVYGGVLLTDYVHDLHVQDGIGHAAVVWAGEYRLLDVTTWPFQVLGARLTAARFSHNVWAGAQDRMAVATDEQEGALVQFWDVGDPTTPELLSGYSTDTRSVPHNAFLHRGLCHVAWYTEGYRLLDARDPLRPKEIGFYDTYAGAPGPQEGAFGVYPFQPSGVVYVSDRDAGLFVLLPHLLRIDHEPLADTPSEAGPYRVLARLGSESVIEEATLFWSVNGQPFQQRSMRPVGGLQDLQQGGVPGTYVGRIPGQAAPATVRYFITAADRAGGVSREPWTNTTHSFHVGPQTRVYFDDFEGAVTWTHGGTTDDWERGTPAGRGWTARGIAWLDPLRPYSGGNVWGNDLGLAGGEGDYPSRGSSWLQSEPIPTQGVQGLRLRFQRWLTVEADPADRARVLVNGQVVWQNPATHLLDFRWTEVDLDVSAITDDAAMAVIRFELQSNSDMEVGGWALDDVELYAIGSGAPDGRR